MIDARDEFANDFLVPALRANALYEGKYPLVSALSRPVIVEHLVASARRHGADAVGHGCTGKGNDQVRFEVSTARPRARSRRARAGARVGPHPRRLHRPRREVGHPDRGDEGEAVFDRREHVGPRDRVRRDREPVGGRARGAVHADRAPARRAERGDARSSSSSSGACRSRSTASASDSSTLIDRLGPMVGAYGFGRIDMVENRRVGIKSREVYECPASLALIAAHRDLESVTLERDVAREKQRLEIRVAELIYDGLWHSPLMRALDAFMVSTQEHVTGEVRLRLEAGRCDAVGRRAPRGLYDHDLATYDAEDSFRHEDSAGFVRLWGLSVETWSRRQGPGCRRHGSRMSGGETRRRRAADARSGTAGSRRPRPTSCSRSRSACRSTCGSRPTTSLGSRAHVAMLDARRSPRPTTSARVIIAALDRVETELESGTFAFVADRRRHPHRDRAPGHRSRRPGRRQAAHRPQPQRPGRARPAPLPAPRRPRAGRAHHRAARGARCAAPRTPATRTSPATRTCSARSR